MLYRKGCSDMSKKGYLIEKLLILAEEANQENEIILGSLIMMSGIVVCESRKAQEKLYFLMKEFLRTEFPEQYKKHMPDELTTIPVEFEINE